jgi:hypothetical protein
MQCNCKCMYIYIIYMYVYMYVCGLAWWTGISNGTSYQTIKWIWPKKKTWSHPWLFTKRMKCGFWPAFPWKNLRDPIQLERPQSLSDWEQSLPTIWAWSSCQVLDHRCLAMGFHPSDLSENRMSQKLDDEPPCFPDERQTQISYQVGLLLL